MPSIDIQCNILRASLNMIVAVKMDPKLYLSIFDFTRAIRCSVVMITVLSL